MGENGMHALVHVCVCVSVCVWHVCVWCVYGMYMCNIYGYIVYKPMVKYFQNKSHTPLPLQTLSVFI